MDFFAPWRQKTTFFKLFFSVVVVAVVAVVAVAVVAIAVVVAVGHLQLFLQTFLQTSNGLV